MQNLESYTNLKNQYLEDYKKTLKTYNFISLVRILLAVSFLTFIYFFLKNDYNIFLWLILAAFIIFFLVMKWHDKVFFRKVFSKTLEEINLDEINFLENNKLPFEDGIEYLPKTHDYAFDLDFFGKNSIFQTLNRTATFIGKKTLANQLLTLNNNNEILENQKAINELSKKLDFRQEIFALSKMTHDSKLIYHQMTNWSKRKDNLSLFYKIISFLSPMVLLIFMGMYYYSINPIFSKIAVFIFLLNLGIFATFYKKAIKEIANLNKLSEIFNSYKLIFEKIEEESFESEKLKRLQDDLSKNGIKASAQFQILASIFRKMESIQNVFGAIITNGLFLYHFHAYRELIRWKEAHGEDIIKWVDLVGEIEMLNSFANLFYNNPDFCFPDINNGYDISLENLGHPLIQNSERINNNVNFTNQKFIILTGSNMSGKSTFLRSLGVNMVLAGIGAPVCASSANIHPLQVLVSMRLSDSLDENESYFFAEVKRLKNIMNTLDERVSFVLLDEILRGTNSEDKRSGTIEVIKKMINKKAIGVIATHDLEVCNTTKQFPEDLVNKNFEVEIIENELIFDYKLRDGICKNKSATFLMKKMDVI